MSPRELQSIISMLEAEYEDNNHTSLAATIAHIQRQGIDIENTYELQMYLKSQQGMPTGRIARVVSKQLFNHLANTDETLLETVKNASELFNCQPRELNDDMFCRYFSS